MYDLSLSQNTIRVSFWHKYSLICLIRLFMDRTNNLTSNLKYFTLKYWTQLLDKFNVMWNKSTKCFSLMIINVRIPSSK